MDLRTAAGYGALPEEVREPGFFGRLFQEVWVLHGDWGLDQIIISSEGPVIVDLGKSFSGPRILDVAHRFGLGVTITSSPRTLNG